MTNNTANVADTACRRCGAERVVYGRRQLQCRECNTKLAILDSDSPYAVRMRAYLNVEVVRK